MGPFDRAEDQIEKAYENEELTSEEYEVEMRYLRAERRGHAEEQAGAAYDEAMGIY